MSSIALKSLTWRRKTVCSKYSQMSIGRTQPHMYFREKSMKKSSFVVLMMLLTAISSCKKKNNSTSDSSSGSGTTGSAPSSTGPLSYKEGSADVTVDSANAVLYTTSDVGGPRARKVDIYAFKAGKQVLEFHFAPKTGAQNVAQNFSSAWLTFMTNNGMDYPGDYYGCTTGHFSLSVCDTVNNKITGTFDFTGNNGSSDKNITNGNINLTKLKKQ